MAAARTRMTRKRLLALHARGYAVFDSSRSRHVLLWLESGEFYAVSRRYDGRIRVKRVNEDALDFHTLSQLRLLREPRPVGDLLAELGVTSGV